MARFKRVTAQMSGVVNDPDGKYDVIWSPRPALARGPNSKLYPPAPVQDVYFYPNNTNPLPSWEPARTLTAHVIKRDAFVRDAWGDYVGGWGGTANNRYAVDLGKVNVGVYIGAYLDLALQNWNDGLWFEDCHRVPAVFWKDYITDLASYARFYDMFARIFSFMKGMGDWVINGAAHYYVPSIWGINKLEGVRGIGFEDTIGRRDYVDGQYVPMTFWFDSMRRSTCIAEAMGIKTDNDDRRERYWRVVAAMCMITETPLLATWMEPGQSNDGALDHPFFDQLDALGETKSGPYYRKGVWRRPCQNGIVYLNLGDAPVKMSRSLTVPALDAVIVN
uniref:Uncharacterized protein n=1 Tax=viral metagenome TaxID=1070528 RepID=A0A6M3LPG6_9ZZZZ